MIKITLEESNIITFFLGLFLMSISLILFPIITIRVGQFGLGLLIFSMYICYKQNKIKQEE